MSDPLISVVIPAFNQAHFLRQAIDSVLAQTLTDYELIVVDDGSTDDTALVAASYGDALHYLWQVNGGLAAARNAGIRHASGRYIALLDSDDWWEPTLLATLYALAQCEPESAVWYCGVQYVDEMGQRLPQAPSISVVPPEQCRAAFLRGNFIVPSATLLVRETLFKVGLFDTDYRRLQDWELWVRLVLQGYTLAGVAMPLVNYRIHGSSLSTDPTGGQRAAMALAIKHFGEDEGGVVSAEKAHHFAGVYLYHAITSSLVRANDWQTCAYWLAKALQLDPSIADDQAVFYELALGAQPLGYRGTAQRITLIDNFRAIEQVLTTLAAEGKFSSRSLQRKVQGMAWFAFGWAAYHQNELALCRKAWRRTARYRPQLLCQRSAARAFLLAHATPLRSIQLQNEQSPAISNI